MHAALKIAAGIAVCIASGVALSGPAMADPTPTPSPTATPRLHTIATIVDPGPNRLGRIVVHASAREGYTIPVAELERLGARTIADALQYVPGVVVQQYGTTGTLQTVALRGATAAQTLVLLDGRPVNEGDTGVTDFTSMPLDSVEGISVIEGGLSTQFGSGAVGGVIEIVSRRPDVGSRGSAYARLGYEGAYTGGFSGSLGDNTGGIRVDATTRSERNTFDYPSFAGIAGGVRTDNDDRAADVSACVCYDFGPQRRFGAYLHLNDDTSDVGAPGNTEFGPQFVSQFARQQRDVNRSAFNLRYSIDNSQSTATFFADGRRVHFYDPTPSFPYDTLTLATDRGFALGELVRIGKRNLVSAKYDGRNDVALFQGTIYIPGQVIARASSTDAYLGDNYWNGAFEADGGIRFDSTQGSAHTALPSIAVRERIGPLRGDRDTFVRASYSRAFRAPNLDERYFPGFGNPKLQPEYAATFDAGIFSDGERLGGAATWFGSDTSNLIVNQAIDMFGDFLPFNVGRARVRGFSLEVNNGYTGPIGIQASYTAYPVAEDLSTAPDINGVITQGNRLLRRPTATGSIEIWRRVGGQTGRARGEDGLDIRFIGRRFDDEENTHLLPPYATLGAHASRDIGNHFKITLRADNLTGERVEEVYGYPVLGTTFSVRVDAR